MKRKVYLKIFVGIAAFVLLIKLLTVIFIEPWVGEKIEATLNEKYDDYIVEINNVHISWFSSGLVLENLTIGSRNEHGRLPGFSGEIVSIKLKGINLAKVLFKKQIQINEITISEGSFNGKIPFPKKAGPPLISTLNIRIDSILFDKINLAIENTSDKKSFSVKEGVLKVYDLHVEKQDTLAVTNFNHFDIVAEELIAVTEDSMYTVKATGLICPALSNTLTIDSFNIHPNYKNYDFAARHKFASDRIEAGFSNIFAHNFSLAGYLKSGDLISTYIEIGNMDLKVFRDNRKIIPHVKKPEFQDMMYNYSGSLCIDSIGLLNGNVIYTEHVEKANEPGNIRFNNINAKIFNITNDTIYKSEKAYFKMKGEALLMGKGKFTVLLKGRIYDIHNTFSLNGTLSGMDANELNPILEKNTFIYATSGKIDTMNFSFTANNNKATGKMKLLYHGLNIAVKNKRTDDTSAINERLSSLIANMKLLNSNPVPGKAVREGIVKYDRDPERFFFNYCFKSILSGIKSSLTASPKK